MRIHHDLFYEEPGPLMAPYGHPEKLFVYNSFPRDEPLLVFVEVRRHDGSPYADVAYTRDPDVIRRSIHISEIPKSIREAEELYPVVTFSRFRIDGINGTGKNKTLTKVLKQIAFHERI